MGRSSHARAEHTGSTRVGVTAVVLEQGMPAMPEQGTPMLLVPEEGTTAMTEGGQILAVLEQDLATCHCSLWQQVPGQDGMLLLAQGFMMRKHTISPAETIAA